MRPLVSLSALNTLTSCTLVEPTTSAAADPKPGNAPVPLPDAQLDQVTGGAVQKVREAAARISEIRGESFVPTHLRSIAAALEGGTAPGMIIGGGDSPP